MCMKTEKKPGKTQSRLIEKGLSLIFPRYCIFCGEELSGGSICSECRIKLQQERIQRPCRICGRALISEKELCTQCREHWKETGAPFEQNGALFPYQGMGKILVGSYKFRNMKSLSLPIAELVHEGLIAYMEHVLPELAVRPPIIPVPFRKTGKRDRGWDPVEEICRSLASRFGWVIYPCLNRRGNRQQKTMGREERQINMQRSISFRSEKRNLLPDIRGGVILLDDVYTTGATLSACAGILRSEGFCRIFTFTIVVD